MLKLKGTQWHKSRWINPRHVAAVAVATYPDVGVMVYLVGDREAFRVPFQASEDEAEAAYAAAEAYAAELVEAIDRANGGQS